MSTRTVEPAGAEPDQRIFLRRASWGDYERILTIRGESSGVRVSYLDGEIELMSPSRHHERIKSTIARLVEAFALERGIDLSAFGSWTLREEGDDAGAEPDECYVVGAHEPERPDLAIEVVWSSGSLDKLEIYRRLGVPEVWFWIKGKITIHRLRDEGYEAVPRSGLFADLDLDHLTTFVDRKSMTQSVREYTDWLRTHPPA